VCGGNTLTDTHNVLEPPKSQYVPAQLFDRPWHGTKNLSESIFGRIM
jgi:hypothetical protein